MEKTVKTRQTSASKIMCLMLILLVSLLVIQAFQPINAQNSASNQWALTLQTQKVGDNTTSSTFSPFDQIQLTANVTYGNASQPDVLVYFAVQSPSNSTALARTETTNSQGQAQFSFRLPIAGQNESAITGTWQTTASIQTTNGTIQQTCNFTTQWEMQITSLNLLDQQGQNQTSFTPGSTVTAQLTIHNLALAQTANITFNMQDATGKIINQTQMLNSQIEANSSNDTQLQSGIQIPADAVSGQATITAAIYNGSYAGVDLPCAENKTSSFTITSNGGSSTPTASPTATPTATASASPTPSATSTALENSVSLFSWLLVATGFFTFSILFLFLKRKPTLQIPKLPTVIPTPPTAAPPLQTPSLTPSYSPIMPPQMARASMAQAEQEFAAVISSVFDKTLSSEPTNQPGVWVNISS